MGEKRQDYISWDEYFMGVAMLSGMRSKDPNTQVGACIVSQDNKIFLCHTCRAECDSELPGRKPGRSQDLCSAFSL